MTVNALSFSDGRKNKKLKKAFKEIEIFLGTSWNIEFGNTEILPNVYAYPFDCVIVMHKVEGITASCDATVNSKV